LTAGSWRIAAVVTRRGSTAGSSAVLMSTDAGATIVTGDDVAIAWHEAS